MILSTPHPPKIRSAAASSLRTPFTLHPDVNIEEALSLACEYLAGASATAYETADNCSQEFRALARAVVNQIEVARTLVEATAAKLESDAGLARNRPQRPVAS